MSTLSRILCVEDDPDIRLLLQLALGKLGGFKVVMVASGEEALELLSDSNPDLLLLDLMLPGISGLDTLQQARCQPGFGELKAVLLTAGAHIENLSDWEHEGLLGVVSKPFDPVGLAARIRGYLT